MNVENLHRRPHSDAPGSRAFLAREWLVTNGLGGYASGTLCGASTRRYHGLLIAALPVPHGRFVMFDHLAVEAEFDGSVQQLDLNELSPEALELPAVNVGEFSLEAGLPVWRYAVGPYLVERRILLPHLQNTVYIRFQLLAGPDAIRLRLRPAFHFRPHDASLSEALPPYEAKLTGQRLEISSPVAPPLRMRLVGPAATVTLDDGQVRQVYYGAERARGYDYRGAVWSPGCFQGELRASDELTLIASTHRWEVFADTEPRGIWAAAMQRREHLLNEAAPAAREGFGAELALAADQFIIRPIGRVADDALAAAAGDEALTVIAGYHWFTDWGRDTMISLEGLTLVTGRPNDARNLLRMFARHVHDGLIPNLFPEGKHHGLYHTADATLWYFHALARYLEATGDHETLGLLLPTLHSIVEWHFRGTDFGIGVDAADGLLRQGQAGFQLTWMDAKVGDWVVTPRRGKAVEINALWYNALRLLEDWNRAVGDPAAADRLAQQADRVHDSFNRRFWHAQGEYLYDVVDGEQGDDASFRPNQIFALSLDHPVLAPSRWKTVLEKVTDRLLTPVGLRTLAPGSPDYKAAYDGDLRSRDAAYHQGTVWAWLIGPYVDAWLRVEPSKTREARRLLAAFDHQLDEACVGSISEIFDAEPPFHPRGCVAQAWSVAEVLRCWVKTGREQG